MSAISSERQGLLDRMTMRINRRQLAKSGGLLAAGGLLGRPDLLRSSAQGAPTAGATINALITLEAFAVTFFGAARSRGSLLAFDESAKSFVLASQCEEEAHFHFFEAEGALSATTTFTIAAAQLENQDRFFSSLVSVESILVGAYMSAARQFAAFGDLRLVEISYQIGAVEAQHLAVTRLLQGERLASNRAFAQWMFGSPVEAVTALAEMGYISGKGDEYVYPGPVDRYCRGVTGLVAESSEDQPAPAPNGAATPVRSGPD